MTESIPNFEKAMVARISAKSSNSKLHYLENPDTPDVRYPLVSYANAEKFIKKPKLLAVDTETSGLSVWRGARICAVGIAADGQGMYFPFNHCSPGIPEPVVSASTGKELPSSIKRRESMPSDLPEQQGQRWAGQLDFDLLGKLMKSLTGVPCVFHNAKFDLLQLMLSAEGMVRGWTRDDSITWLLKMDIHDTMLMARVIKPTAANIKLKYLAEKIWKGSSGSEKELKDLMKLRGHGAKDDPHYDWVAPREEYEYCITDCELTWRLATGPFVQWLAQQENESLYNQERELLVVVTLMELHGVKVSQNKIRTLQREGIKIVEWFLERAYHYAGEEINMNSWQQITKAFENCGVDLAAATAATPFIQKENNKKQRQGGKPTTISTKDEVLATINHPLAHVIRNYRKFHTIESTFLSKLDVFSAYDGRVHGSFNQARTVTGRFSSSEPNLQNLRREPPEIIGPKEFCDAFFKDFDQKTIDKFNVRNVYIPEKGTVLVLMDYSQIEYRLMAFYSEDEAMLAAFNAGKDLHQETCDRLNNRFGEGTINRKASKNFNFAQLYGISDLGLAAMIDMDVRAVSEMRRAYRQEFPGVGEFTEEVKSMIKQRGYVQNLYGRRYHLPSDMAYVGINYLCQGSSADMIKEKMIVIANLIRERGSGIKMILQVHDELVFEVPVAELKTGILLEIKNAMEDFNTEIPHLRPAIDSLPIITDVEIAKQFMGSKKELTL